MRQLTHCQKVLSTVCYTDLKLLCCILLQAQMNRQPTGPQFTVVISSMPHMLVGANVGCFVVLKKMRKQIDCQAKTLTTEKCIKNNPKRPRFASPNDNTPFSKMAAENSNKLKLKTYTSTIQNTFTLIALESFSISGVLSAEKIYRRLYDWGMHYTPSHTNVCKYNYTSQTFPTPLICQRKTEKTG